MIANNVLGLVFSDTYNECLNELTALRTMGSVPFGARYRFIDFALSNMVNCGISKVGVVTKSNYRSLMDHLGTGKPWDLSRKHEGLFLLPPFSNGQGTYSGRIEALTYNRDFIHMSKEDTVILYDTNIVCNMDVGNLLEYHYEKNADITICCKDGTAPARCKSTKLTLSPEGKITKISIPCIHDNMPECYGVNIIVIRKSILERFINEALSENYKSFEKDIIMKNLDNLAVFGYKIDTFCSVIDSLKSYYDTSMALLNPQNAQAVFDRTNPVYTKVNDDMPSIYGIGSRAKNCIIADGCKIEGEVENSVLFRGVHIAKGASVKNSIIMQACYISENSNLNCIIMDKYSVVRPGKQLSGDKSYPIYIGKSITI